jgi:hypothetical protein
MMDLDKVLQQLHEELRNLNAAIASLEHLQEAGLHHGKSSEWLESVPRAVAARKRKAKPKDEAAKKD